MNTIIVNGNRFEVKGNNISIKNNSVYVDGVLIKNGLSGDINVSFDGELANLTCSGSANVTGMVHGNVDAGGSVNCGAVDGNVDAGGSVVCGVVGGDVDAGGSVKVVKWNV